MIESKLTKGLLQEVIPSGTLNACAHEGRRRSDLFPMATTVSSLENNEAEAQGRRSCQRTLIAEPLP
jgi:hypothetical protein